MKVLTTAISTALLVVGVLSVRADIMVLPTADTLLSNDPDRGATVNHGSAAQWQVRWHSAPRVRIGYVQYDISGVDPSLFSTATFSGTFTGSSYNGPSSGGSWNVYGLNDDVVADGLGRQGNDWDESTITYANAAGVDNAAAEGTFSFLAGETTLLGTMSFDGVDVQPLPFASNTTDLDLSGFLNADTDGLVTFLFMDIAQNGDEYRVDSLEGNTADGHGPMALVFVPEPSVAMLMLGGLGILSLARRRNR
jgi:hypothetical protein